MPKIDQQSIRIFHILGDNNSNDLLVFLKKNLPLFRGYLLVFDNISPDIVSFLDSNDVDYIKNKHLRFINDKVAASNVINSINRDEEPGSSVVDVNDTHSVVGKDCDDTLRSKFITRLIRSGESIYHGGDILIFNRVNSGAKIESDSNVCIFGTCEGDVKCEGDFLLLSSISKGKVDFQGIIITPNMLRYKLNIIYKCNNELNIRDALSFNGV